jgi:putative colanic acid biosysnthesis UDP-glucose lipid carrier transferase
MDTITKENIGRSDLKVIKQHFTIPVPYKKEDTTYDLLKRFFDITIASVLLLAFLSWIYPLMFILINISSKGGTLFIQKRVGLRGKVFNCFKFRTMVLNKESDQVEAVLNDKRITKIGQFLRMTYIDELPQLINVLLGDMSIVGPRPHMLYHHRKFCSEIPLYNYRHQVKPGITGLSQVKGYHGAVFGQYRIYGRTRLDLFYVRKASLKLDLIILIKTGLIICSFNKKTK